MSSLMLDTRVPITAIASSSTQDSITSFQLQQQAGKTVAGFDIDSDNLTSLRDIEDALQKICQEETIICCDLMVLVCCGICASCHALHTSFASILCTLATTMKKIEERLEWSVSNRHQLEARLAQVSKLLPTLQAVQGDACRLQSTIASTQQLATAVSARVRRLDIAKRGVAEVQSRVNDLLDLEGCAGGVATALHQEDYETAAAHIHRFLAMDESLLLHSAEHSANKGSRSIETWFERLRAAESELSALIERRLDEAVTAQDSASVDRFFKLFPLINRRQQGLAKFSAFLCAKIQETGEACMARCRAAPATGPRAHLLWADAATELFESVARIVEVRQPIVETYYGPGQLVQVVTELVSETDRQAGRLISEMRRHRKLDALTTAVNEALSSVPGSDGGLSSGSGYSSTALPDPRALDGLLGELTLLNARADLFLRFMKRRVVADLEASVVEPEELNKQVDALDQKLWRSQVACDMAAVIGQYSILEQFYLNRSFAKALTLDTATITSPSAGGLAGVTLAGGSRPSDGGRGEGDDATAAPVSSVVDDAFYIIKKSVRRAIASSSCDGVCAVLNHAVTLLETQLANGFLSTLKRGFPATGYIDIAQAYTAWQTSLQTSLQTGKLNASTTDSDALRHTFLTALNSAETSQRHVTALEAGLQEAVTAAMTGLSANSHNKIQSCFGDLRNSGLRLQTVTEFGLSQLRATAIKPRVKTWMQAFSATSHDITEEEFSGYEAHDPFSESLLVSVDGLLSSFRPLLTSTNHAALTAALVQEVAQSLEQAMLKMAYNRLGGLLVDREVRAVAGLLSQAAQWSVREQLARLTQMATLLNLDHLHEVEEYSGGASWRLTPAEMRKTLQLRVDFKYEDIKRLKL